MLQSEEHINLPSSETLPCSDDTPVDNELQNYIPNFLLFLLEFIWQERQDWFFGADMAVYHTTGKTPLVPVVPDGFLSLNVPRRKEGQTYRKSYVIWEENYIAPLLTLEVVSLTPGGEYEEKLEIYARLGVLYYVIYNPLFWLRDRHQPFEIYKLIDGGYELQIGEPYWMPEIGLGIGRKRGNFGGLDRELLFWFDAAAQSYRTPEEILSYQAQILERYRQQFGDLTSE
ncbi:MAG: hypothetical protein N5P05_001302 [Chroococcopsis gigantea SAG 12.99]|jgi:Uma2 family endonuclease|nr:Uma2 family endonuclease [Chlorogloea purpurea SAG 13.99]MDV2999696.1 hypothetical protein [Chroococcopsis gigantea SAG 12.99]